MNDDKNKSLEEILLDAEGELLKNDDSISLDDILKEYGSNIEIKSKEAAEKKAVFEVKQESVTPEIITDEKEQEPIKINFEEQEPKQEKHNDVWYNNAHLEKNIDKWLNDNKEEEASKNEVKAQTENIVKEIEPEQAPIYNKKKIDSFFENLYSEDDNKDIEKKLVVKHSEDVIEDEEAGNADVDEIDIEGSEPKVFSGVIGKLFDEDDNGEEPAYARKSETTEEIEEYEEPDDTESIKEDLGMQKKEAFFKTALALCGTALLLYLSFGTQFTKILPSFLQPSNGFTFGFANTILTLLVIMSGFKTFIGGLSKLFSFKPDNDSLPSLALFAVLLHSILVMLNATPLHNYNLYIFNGIASLTFTLTLLGKHLHISAVLSNFTMITTDNRKLSLSSLSSYEVPKAVKISENEACAAVETEFVSGFLERSFSDDPSQKLSLKMTPYIYIAILISSFLVLFKGSLLDIPAAFAAICVVCASFMSGLAYILPYFRETAAVRKTGGMITGYGSAVKNSEIIALAINDIEIFNPKYTSITGIKMINNSEIYDTIVKIASLFSAVGGPLSGAFLKVLDNKSELLKEVGDIKIHEGRGVSGVIDGERVFAGDALFMKSCGIVLENDKFDASRSREGKTMILFGEGEKMSAVFAASYGIDSLTISAIRKLDSAGISLLINSDDYNITQEMLEKRLEIKQSEIFVFGQESAPKLNTILKPKERVSSGIVSVTGLLGIQNALKAAKKIKRSVKICLIARTISIIAGLLVSAFMVYNNSAISPVQIIGFQGIWTFLSVIAALISI